MVSGPARLYIGMVVLLTAVLVDRTPMPKHGLSWAILIVLQALFLVCDSVKTPLASRQTKWSPSSAATLAAVVLLGPMAAAIVGATSLLSARPGLRLAERLFNAATQALCGLLAGLVYMRLGGHPGLVLPPHPAPLERLAPRSPLGFPWVVIVPFVAAAAVHVAANHVLVWGVSWLNRANGGLGGEPLESGVTMLLASDLGYALLGLMVASLWTVLGWVAAVIVLAPLFVARWAMGQFAGQQRAYAATMTALCQAVETKDFYTRGHGDRVSKGAVMIARQIGMSPNRSAAIRFAGMLHDVGKLGVPTQVLQKTGALTEDEYAVIQLHPMRGLDIVREIGFLFEALTGILHHHERIDGTGYPMGLAGHEIPEFARVIAVADAFDSMTSTRSYREAKLISQAVDELRRGAGTQFDPLLVEAFIAALEKEEWPLAEPAMPPPDPATVTVQDHDDPTAPLQVVIP